MAQWKILAALLLPGFIRAQEPIPAFQRVSGLPHAVVLRRISAGANQDLVVALASAAVCEAAPRPCGWNTKDRLGILLQNRGDPNDLSSLAVVPGPNDDCSTRILRFTTEDLVLSCTGEKWAVYDNQKFVFDLAHRRLASHSAYAPFATIRLLPGPKIVMAAGERQLLVEIDEQTGNPRVSTAAVPLAPPESNQTFGGFHLARQSNRYGSEHSLIAGNGKLYPVPQTDKATWARDRPDEGPPNSPPDLSEMNEEIGPHQLSGGVLWFGKTFYNGEGLTGVGGFGWFDPAIAGYHLISPPEIHRWSVSAILVEADAVWLALDHRGEYGDYPGGLLRWDRQSQSVQHWDLDSIATVIARHGEALYLGTNDGIAVLRDGKIKAYFVDRAAPAQYRIAERN